MSYTYAYPRPAFTVDALVFDPLNSKLLLIQRGKEPFLGKWALPGGFVDMDETPEAAVCRELEEETGLKDIILHQMHTFGSLGRDPRHRTISTVYFCKQEGVSKQKVVGQDDAAEANWFSLDDLPDMAFDHLEIIAFFKHNRMK